MTQPDDLPGGVDRRAHYTILSPEDGEGFEADILLLKANCLEHLDITTQQGTSYSRWRVFPNRQAIDNEEGNRKTVYHFVDAVAIMLTSDDSDVNDAPQYDVYLYINVETKAPRMPAGVLTIKR